MLFSKVLYTVSLGLAPGAQAASLFVSHFSGTVYTLSYTANGNGKGNLAISSTSNGCGAMPTWLTLDSASNTLYCFDESSGMWGGSAKVSSLTVGNGGALQQKGQATTSGGDVYGSLYGGVNGTGFLAMAEYDPSTISTYKLPLSSSSQALEKKQFTMSSAGPNPSRQNKPHPHSAFPDPTGKYLLVPDLGADLIRVFSIDSTSGKLSECPAAKANPGDGPRHGAFWAPQAGSTEGQMLYTVNELGNSVTTWKLGYSGSSGCLSLSKNQTLSSFPPNKTPQQHSQPYKAAEVHVKGNFLYASNRNDQLFGSQQDSMTTYAIGADGGLAYADSTNTHAWYVRTFAINKAGDMVAMGGQTSSNVAIVARDPSTGKLGDLLATLSVGNRGTDGGENGLSSVIWNE